MRNNSLPIVVLALVALLAFSGCGENNPQTTEVPVTRKVAPPTKKEMPVQLQESAPEPVAPPYVYDPTGRRDPFESPLGIKKSLPALEVPLTPLQKYDVGQLKLIGMIIGKGEPRAMVIAPDGKSYILKKGVKVGKNDGTVVEITENAVLVKEVYLDFSGEVRTGVQEIMLPKKEGVE